MPPDEELERDVREILSTGNLAEVTLKAVRKQLEDKWQVDLSSKKAFLRETVTALLAEEGEEEGEEEGSCDDDGHGGDEYASETEEHKNAFRRKAAAKKRTELQLSPALFELLGSKEEFMTRGEVTKAIWAYIRAESLQDPNDGRKIRNDDRMLKVFKCKTMNMMHISKKLTPHLKKASELVGAGEGDGDEAHSSGKRGRGRAGSTPAAKRVKAGAGTGGTTSKPSASQRRAADKHASSKGSRKASSAGSGGAGEQRGEDKIKRTRQPSKILWRVSDELAAVVGTHEASVDAIRSAVHKYIKDHDLADPAQRTMVICDPTLEKVMGQKVVKMFGMQSLIARHRLHKLER